MGTLADMLGSDLTARMQRPQNGAGKCLHCDATLNLKSRDRRGRPPSRYCSRRCERQHQYTPRNNPGQTCERCGRIFDGHTRLYCSKECREEYHKDRQYGEIKQRTCSVCQSVFTGRPITCSARCRQTLSLYKAGKCRKFVFCKECGVIFRPRRPGHKTYCSRGCAFKNGERGFASTVNKRTLWKNDGRPLETFSRTEIFLRDDYRCQLCKRKTKPKEHWKHPLYPHCDHVIPLSKGGPHIRANAQCLCGRCNLKKNNDITTLF